MLDQITNVTEYLKAYGGELAEKIKKEAKPLFNSPFLKKEKKPSTGIKWCSLIS